MSIADLCALDVSSLVADNAVLFLWITTPLLEDCFQVIKAWGFTYKALFVRDKVRHNFGHYNSVRCELLLICTRGSCLPDVDEQVDNVIDKVDTVITIPKSSTHSQKPEKFRHLIDRLYPHGPRIELFARERRPGWSAWGNDVSEQR